MTGMTETTPDRLKGGVKIDTEKLTTLRVMAPTLEILIGGPYRGRDGEMHTYGHAALRVITTSVERVYDFGRYGNVTGDFGAEGEGILRVWDSFDSYIAGENAYGRVTKGFSYLVSADQAEKVIAHFNTILATAAPRRPKHPRQKEFKLVKNYHALTHNCVTLTLAGAKVAMPGIDAGGPSHNEGRGMSTTEKIAARAKNYGAWPTQIFMPADVQALLEAEKRYIPRSLNSYGVRKK